MEVLFDYNTSTRKLLFTVSCIEEFSRIREHFSIENTAARFARRFNQFIPRRKYIISPTGSCDLGIYYLIRKYLIDNQIICNINITEKLKLALDTGRNTETLYTSFKFDLRDYQTEVLTRALKAGRGTCVLGTGAGKTFTTAALIENFFQQHNRKELFKCLVIVPDLGLVEQTYNEFIDSGITFKATKWTGSHKPDLTSNIVICNIGILQSQFQQNPWVQYIDLLIVDECHKIKPDNKISKIVSKIKTQNRYGFTGTLPEDQIDKWSVIGKFGPIIYEKTSFDLRKEDFLSNVEIKIIDIQYKDTPPKISDNAYRNELQFIYNSIFRNDLIKSICNKLNNNTLILVNHIEHGERILANLANTPQKQVYFIRGEIDVIEREKIKKIMEESSNVICIAISAIFSTGVNIKNLHNIVFAAGGKSFIRTVQSIGRGLRKHNTKNKLIIIDLADKLQYGISHSIKRQTIYTKEKINFSIKTILQP
jgi:superfamily II DNA or RNA helicase